MTRWEYKAVMLNDPEAELNQLGKHGWELVTGGPIPRPPSQKQIIGSASGPFMYHGVLKRPLVTSTENT